LNQHSNVDIGVWSSGGPPAVIILVKSFGVGHVYSCLECRGDPGLWLGPREWKIRTGFAHLGPAWLDSIELGREDNK
jgi:hypothetical protein